VVNALLKSNEQKFSLFLLFAASGCRFSLPLLVAVSGCRLIMASAAMYPIRGIEGFKDLWAYGLRDLIPQFLNPSIGNSLIRFQGKEAMT
jgi:hypothetical protein